MPLNPDKAAVNLISLLQWKLTAVAARRGLQAYLDFALGLICHCQRLLRNVGTPWAIVGQRIFDSVTCPSSWSDFKCEILIKVRFF